MNLNNIKKEIFNQNIEKIDEKQAFLLVNIICLLGHIIYFTLFHKLEVTPMENYNYFSMVYYVVMIFLTVKVKRSGILIVVSLAEIVLHSVLGTYYLGWDIGFAQYLIFIIPIPFMPKLERKSIPYIASIMDFIVYCILKIFCGESYTPKYILDQTESTMLFYINSIFGLVIILYISSIFLLQRNINEIKLQKHNKLLRQLATTDPLTKLYNRRAMTEYLKLMDKKNKENNLGYFVGLADIDDFKKINDTYGHDSGDEVLVKVAEIMMKSVPEDACVCRWGGEEILIVIPGCTMEKGFTYAENIRSKIENLRFASIKNDIFRITVTIGVYEGSATENPETAIRHADDRLYIGKNSGKNKVVSSDSNDNNDNV